MMMMERLGFWRKTRDMLIIVMGMALLVCGFYSNWMALSDSDLPAMIRPITNVWSLLNHKDHHKVGINIPTRVAQCEATLLFLKVQVESAPEGSLEKKRAQKELDDEMMNRNHIDCAFNEIGKALFGEEYNYHNLMAIHQPADWDCYKTMPTAFMKHCGQLWSGYGFHKVHAFANICNAGFQPDQVAEVASQVCDNKCNLTLVLEKTSTRSLKINADKIS